MIDKYVDWLGYWKEEIECQIESLEDYEPKLINTTYEDIRGFMSCYDEIVTQDCTVDSAGTTIVFGLGYDEDGVSLTFAIGNDDLINLVEFR